MTSDRIVGIDLGTSNTVIAYVDELDKVRLAPDPEGHSVHPSVVSFHPGGGVVVGVAGKQRKVLDPKNTIYSAKRMIGQPFNSPAVQQTARRVPFTIVEGPNKQAMVVTRAGEFAIPEVSAIILDHARKLASTAMQTDVGRAVVTVPASFTDVQRSSTATAGALAGLTVVRVLNEPTAAAIAYGSTRRLDEIIAVYDWGGGTFDITILKLHDQVYTVLGTSGDAFLGGEDMDERLVGRMAESFLAKHRVDVREDEVAMMRLRAVAEHTKIELSKRSRALVKVEEIAHGPNGKPIDLEVTLTRDELLSSIGDLVERTFASCKEAMVLAGIGIERVADVVLVGGTTRIPFVRQQVARFFGREPRTDMNPEDAIATGAALQAASMEQMLARAPVRPLASVPIPLDDLEEPVEVEPERSPSQIAEVKRPKRGTDMFSGKPRGAQLPRVPRGPRQDDPVKTAARAKEFFGDLFGDTPKQEIIEKRREPEPKGRTQALPLAARPPSIPAPPEPSMPMIDLSEIEDEFTEKSGELTIDVDRVRRDSGSQIAIEIDPPGVETSSSEIAIEIDPPTVPPGSRGIDIEIDPPTVPPRSLSGISIEIEDDPPASGSIELGSFESAAAIELDPDPPVDVELEHREPSVEIDLIAPSPVRGKRKIPELDWAPPVEPERRTQIGVPAAMPLAEAWPEPPRQTSRPIATVVDVIPRSLGIGTVAGFCEELIPRNSQLPAAVRKLFSTARDFQESVRIIVCQGESRRLENNVLIGDLVLENLPRRRRGETQIEVEFRIDASGILHVGARDVATGHEQRARLDLLGGMAPEDMTAAANRLKQLSDRPARD